MSTDLVLKFRLNRNLQTVCYTLAIFSDVVHQQTAEGRHDVTNRKTKIRHTRVHLSLRQRSCNTWQSERKVSLWDDTVLRIILSSDFCSLNKLDNQKLRTQGKKSTRGRGRELGGVNVLIKGHGCPFSSVWGCCVGWLFAWQDDVSPGRHLVVQREVTGTGRF